MTYIIAEIGQNHEGDTKQALRLVREAIACGVDAVKMQHLVADNLVDRRLPTMGHSASHKTMHERFKSLELPWSTYETAQEICSDYGTDFIISPFSLPHFDRCAELADKIKIASGDLVYPRILQRAAICGKPVIMSTGMASIMEIEAAAELLQPESVMHCISLYPTPSNLSQLIRLRLLQSLLPHAKIGYSCHCIGIDACKIAIAMGATVIEKHFTLTPDAPHGDHKHSLTPDTMRHLIEECLLIEEYMGGADERPDLAMRKWLRRGPSGLRGDQ